MFLAAILTGCGSPPEPAPEAARVVTLRVKGSDSEVNLVQRLTEAYTATRPEVRFAVTGGGSGTGVTALLDGTADIANSSRELTAEEKVLAVRRGLEPVGFVIATDGLAVIVHASNPVAHFDVPTLGALFRGELSTWAEVASGYVRGPFGEGVRAVPVAAAPGAAPASPLNEAVLATWSVPRPP